ncbi:protein kinase [Microbispora sp. RL4-1S]|uniref:non-specific serine/threonine protein kinase n=1 Tax=Microbispora oryzae TaxID=2806554 RepID=A0A940WMK6_9ACTN|nr:protein kinase [Microbispora oryzae]MBP2703821.1 protein kinase [Microbispora oryzae]
MDEAVAVLVPGCQVLGVLGQGGFGTVYRARQLSVGREVALKVDNRVLVSERDRRRFMREVTAAGALSGHPHVADVYDAGVLPDGRPYMVLELCRNGSLADRLGRDGPLGAPEVRDIGIKIADALAAAHAAGVLHRDVKPANILINSYGMVALSDFGLATMPGQGGAGPGEVSVTRESLTPAYAPPEAFDLSEPTPAADVYALSATLYALMTGRPPRFPESGVVNIAAIMALHRLPIPGIPGVPAALTDVLRHGMASDPARRIPAAAALRDALAALAPDGSTGAGQPTGQPAGQPGGQSPGQPTGQPTGRPAGHPAGRPPGPPARSYSAARSEPGTVPAPYRHPTGPPVMPYSGTTAPSRPQADRPRQPARSGRSGQSLVFGAVAAVFALILTAGVAFMIADGDLGGWGRTATPPAGASRAGAPSPVVPRLGVATMTVGCPAADVAGAHAACVVLPECWGGLVVNAGDARARKTDCAKPHTWETFAVGPMPADLTTSDQETVARHPTVAAVCDVSVLMASRPDRSASISADRWEVEVLPPDAARFATGERAYRCLGRVTGPETTGSAFG